MDRSLAPSADPWLLGGSLPPVTAPAQPWLLDPVLRAAFVPPPRPDRSIEAVRDYVRGSYVRAALVLLGCMLAGVVVGYATLPDTWFTDGAFGSGSGIPFTVAGVYAHNLLVVGIPILLFPLLYWAPAVTTGLTGFSVGRLTAAWLHLHLPGGLLAAALLPHGVVEVPATLLGGVIAWRLGRAVWNAKKFGSTLWQRVGVAVRAAVPYLGVVVIALGMAAFIEVKVTPGLVRGLAGW